MSRKRMRRRNELREEEEGGIDGVKDRIGVEEDRDEDEDEDDSSSDNPEPSGWKQLSIEKGVSVRKSEWVRLTTTDDDDRVDGGGGGQSGERDLVQ